MANPGKVKGSSVQEVVCQVFCLIQPFLWEVTGMAAMPALGLLDANLLEMSLKVPKEPAYQAERQIAQARERRLQHCKAEGPQKTMR